FCGLNRACGEDIGQVCPARSIWAALRLIPASLLPQVEFQLRPLAGAGVADAHFTKAILAFHLLHWAECELLQKLALLVVGLGLKDTAGLVVDPGEHTGVAIGSGLGRDAFQDATRTTPAHLRAQRLLLW